VDRVPVKGKLRHGGSWKLGVVSHETIAHHAEVENRLVRQLENVWTGSLTCSCGLRLGGLTRSACLLDFHSDLLRLLGLLRSHIDPDLLRLAVLCAALAQVDCDLLRLRWGLGWWCRLALGWLTLRWLPWNTSRGRPEHVLKHCERVLPWLALTHVLHHLLHHRHWIDVHLDVRRRCLTLRWLWLWLGALLACDRDQVDRLVVLGD